jgi:hypothetical protein
VAYLADSTAASLEECAAVSAAASMVAAAPDDGKFVDSLIKRQGWSFVPALLFFGLHWCW